MRRIVARRADGLEERTQRAAQEQAVEEADQDDAVQPEGHLTVVPGAIPPLAMNCPACAESS